MTPILASANLLRIFSDTDAFGQALTVGLGVFSLVAWTVMFGKFNELKRLQDLNIAFEQRLRDERTLLDLPESLRNKRSIPYADLFADAVESYWRAASILKEKGEDNSRARLEHAENAIQRAIARQVLRYETSMIFLATIVSGAPFIGLLGTVWGVMEAFSAVADQQAASIRTLAPGVYANPDTSTLVKVTRAKAAATGPDSDDTSTATHSGRATRDSDLAVIRVM
jgi:biopolymer transport protein TolQ